MNSDDCNAVSTPSHSTDNSAKQTICVVVTSISKEVSLSAAEWTLLNHLRAGDLLILLGIYSNTCHDSPSYTYDTNRTNEEIEKTAAILESSCKERRVFFKLRSRGGDVMSVIVEEVNALHATVVTLDRNLNLKPSEDMMVIQGSLSCKILMMPKSDDNLNLMQKPVEAEKSYLSNESDGGSSSPSDLESPYLTINIANFAQEVSPDSMPIIYQNTAVSVDALPSVSSSSSFSALDSPIDSFRVPSSFSLPGRLEAQSTSTSSSSIPKPLPRSASDSNFGTREPTLMTEVRPVHIQQRLHENAQELFKTAPGRSFDVSEGSDWLGEGYMIPEEQWNYSYNQQITRGSLLQKRISFCTEIPPTLSQSLLYKSLPQGGRSLLCSVCKQMSLALRSPPRSFSYTELEGATNNFSQDNFLAEGGFGFVYKGNLNGHVVAVKQHKLASTQGYKEFRSEVELLSCAQHRNLVMLLGCCNENGHRMLVYEFVCNKSLDWHLSPTKNPKGLGWAARLKIAIGAARALRYLHEECRVGCIVHRDLRPNNILLTHDYEPMVGDFGLARSHPEGEESIETRIIGTFGYLAPEYAESGQVSWRADVYAFGVVLLELITGRKAIDLLRPPGQQSLTEWARLKLLDDKMMADLVDARLENNFNMNEMHAMMRAAFHCIKKDPTARPRMSQVLHILESETKDSEELSSQLGEILTATVPKIPDSQTSNMQQPATSLSSMSILKSQFRKLQPSGSGSSNSTSRGKPKLLYENML